MINSLALQADTTPMALIDQTLAEDTRWLVERAKSEPDAVALLYRRYVRRIYAFAHHRSGSAEAAEEITSSTFEQALARLPGFVWRGGGFEPWLYRIAATETAAYFRRARRAEGPRAQQAARELAVPTFWSGHDVDVDDAGRSERVVAALARLRPRYQEAISLRYLAGLSHEEAAVAAGCTKPVFAVTLHRAMTALRREVEGAEEVQP
ncbi:MAG TPA: RNA polymerase sigma factor [Acidimicrobiales bacterium]|nr:RNA polymerase sigma factor [Acidimicrobiales bacterium]